MLEARITLTVLLVIGAAALWGNTPRDLLNLAIVLVTPPLIFWFMLRPTRAKKAAQGKAVE